MALGSRLIIINVWCGIDGLSHAAIPWRSLVITLADCSTMSPTVTRLVGLESATRTSGFHVVATLRLQERGPTQVSLHIETTQRPVWAPSHACASAFATQDLCQGQSFVICHILQTQGPAWTASVIELLGTLAHEGHQCDWAYPRSLIDDQRRGYQCRTSTQELLPLTNHKCPETPLNHMARCRP